MQTAKQDNPFCIFRKNKRKGERMKANQGFPLTQNKEGGNFE